MKNTDPIHPIDPAQKSEAALVNRNRTGKIARLPLTLREQLNQRLQEGEAGGPLADWLNGLPEVRAILEQKFQGKPIREQNLSEWRIGGYRAWQKEKAARQGVTDLLEKVIGLKESAQEGLTEQIALFLAARVASELTRLDAMPYGEEKAKMWRELTASLVALRRGDFDRQRLRLQQERDGLRQKTEQEREEEFWKWAEKNINRDEFCRRRCFTYEQREAAVNKILGITPAERGESGLEDAESSKTPLQSGLDPALIQPKPA